MPTGAVSTISACFTQDALSPSNCCSQTNYESVCGQTWISTRASRVHRHAVSRTLTVWICYCNDMHSARSHSQPETAACRAGKGACSIPAPPSPLEKHLCLCKHPFMVLLTQRACEAIDPTDSLAVSTRVSWAGPVSYNSSSVSRLIVWRLGHSSKVNKTKSYAPSDD